MGYYLKFSHPPFTNIFRTSDFMD